MLRIAKFAIPLIIIGYLYTNIPEEKWDQLAAQPKNYRLLAGALLVALLSICISFSRWCLLVRSLGIALPLGEAFRLGAIGFLLNFVSAGSVGGDVFKAIFLARRRPGQRIEAVASILVDRACGLFGLISLVGLAFVVAPPIATAAHAAELERIRYVTAALVSAGIAALAILVLGGRWVDRLVSLASRLRLIGPLSGRIGGPLRMFHRHPLALLAALGMSLCVHIGLTSSVTMIAHGLYTSPPTVAEHFVIVPIGLLASALPITPAGLGVFEAAIHWLYETVPAEPTLASGILVALCFEIVRVLVAVIGTVFYWTSHDEVRNTLAQARAETTD